MGPAHFTVAAAAARGPGPCAHVSGQVSCHRVVTHAGQHLEDTLIESPLLSKLLDTRGLCGVTWAATVTAKPSVGHTFLSSRRVQAPTQVHLVLSAPWAPHEAGGGDSVVWPQGEFPSALYFV